MIYSEKAMQSRRNIYDECSKSSSGKMGQTDRREQAEITGSDLNSGIANACTGERE